MNDVTYEDIYTFSSLDLDLRALVDKFELVRRVQLSKIGSLIQMSSFIICK